MFGRKGYVGSTAGRDRYKGRYRPIDDVSVYKFSRKYDLAANDWLPWLQDEYYDLYRYIEDSGRVNRLASDIIRQAVVRSEGLKRGERIDVEVYAVYPWIDKRLLQRRLESTHPRRGVQFVCFTIRGAAFIKL